MHYLRRQLHSCWSVWLYSFIWLGNLGNSSNTICCNMLKYYANFGLLAAVSCTKVHNVTGNKYKFAQIVQETGTNDHKCDQLLNKILTCNSRWCSLACLCLATKDSFIIYAVIYTTTNYYCPCTVHCCKQGEFVWTMSTSVIQLWQTIPH